MRCCLDLPPRWLNWTTRDEARDLHLRLIWRFSNPYVGWTYFLKARLLYCIEEKSSILVRGRFTVSNVNCHTGVKRFWYRVSKTIKAYTCSMWTKHVPSKFFQRNYTIILQILSLKSTHIIIIVIITLWICALVLKNTHRSH